jgi:hypothetical protein
MSASSCTTRSDAAGASAAVAAELIRIARAIDVPNPEPWLGQLLSRGLRDTGNTLLPGYLPVECSFSQQAPGALRVDVEVVDPVAAARRLVAPGFDAGTQTGDFVGVVIDTTGLVEVKLYQRGGEADPLLTGLPVRPHMVSHVAGRHPVAERVYHHCIGPLPLRSLVPLLGATGNQDTTPAFLAAVAELTGTMVLPPDGAMVALRPVAGGVEVKLEVLAAACPLATAEVAGRIRGLLGAVPVAAAAYDTWAAAVTGGFAAVLPATVVSVRIAPGTRPSLTVYAHPARLAARC